MSKTSFIKLKEAKKAKLTSVIDFVMPTKTFLIGPFFYSDKVTITTGGYYIKNENVQ